MPEFPKAGQMFGEYRVLDVLGRGGMGVVFRAEHVRLKRQVALKVIAPGFSADAEFLARFQREAALQASLDSPHIVSVYDHGEIDGYPFIASQLIAGGDLANFLRDRGPLTRRDATEMTLQVASALAEAHQAGIVHRDVKPSNVLLRAGGEVFVYLCDFGVAQVLDSELTHAGNIVGTYAYLAPERCEGGPATPASDQYALGCLFVAALTGHAPYQGSDIAVAHQHVTSAVPQIQAAQPTDVAINRLLTRLLAKDPQHRFPSMQDATSQLRSLREALASPEVYSQRHDPFEASGSDLAPLPEPTTLRPVTIDGPAPKPAPAPTRNAPRTSPALIVGLAALLAVALIVGAVLLLRPGARTNASSIPPQGTSSTSAPGSASPARTAGGTSRSGSGSTSDSVASQGPLLNMTGALYQNPKCGQGFVVIVKTAVSPDEYDTKLQQGLGEITHDPAKYMKSSESCSGFSPYFTDATGQHEVYNLYVGPFTTISQACDARANLSDQAEDSPMAWIKPLVPDPTKAARLLCSCQMAISSLPELWYHGPTYGIPTQDRRRLVADAQYILRVNNLFPTRAMGGYFQPVMTQRVSQYQASHALTGNGHLDHATWQVMLKQDYCPHPRSLTGSG